MHSYGKERGSLCSAFLITGILVVVTPDSKHQQKNMKMIKSRQTAFSRMGFDRIHYAKHDHLHCLAFRKPCEISRQIIDLANGCGHSFEEVRPNKYKCRKLMKQLSPHKERVFSRLLQMCSRCTEHLAPMLFIHQDRHDYIKKFEPEPLPERPDEEQRTDARLFEELPEVIDG